MYMDLTHQCVTIRNVSTIHSIDWRKRQSDEEKVNDLERRLVLDRRSGVSRIRYDTIKGLDLVVSKESMRDSGNVI